MLEDVGARQAARRTIARSSSDTGSGLNFRTLTRDSSSRTVSLFSTTVIACAATSGRRHLQLSCLRILHRRCRPLRSSLRMHVSPLSILMSIDDSSAMEFWALGARIIRSFPLSLDSRT